MNRLRTLILTLSLILTLTLWILLVKCPEAAHGQGEGDLPDQNDVDSIVIALTHLDVNDQTPDVNDQTLELCYKVKNGSDQDIWVCDGVGWVEDEFEVYLEEDQTLLIRKRLDVPTFIVYYIWPEGQYSRLRAGDERAKSLSINLPVHHHWMFMPRLEKQGVIYARRLVVEIGYHTKDLAQIILDLKDSDDDPNLYNTAIISYLHSANEEEQVLRITVDGVLIPYEDIPVDYVP